MLGRAREVLGPAGPLASDLAAYEERDGQLAMADAVERAIDDDAVLIVEAGTGTGKTLAYLVPAALSGKKVIVSTATKALEEQIFASDIPLVERILGRRIDAALVKGLGNYLCLRRFHELRASAGAFGDAVRRSLPLLESWVQRTEHGDIAELEAIAENDPVWRDVSSSSDTRVGPSCEYFDRCFVTKMRQRANEAQIVVVNHHLFFADLALKRSSAARGAAVGVLPPYDVVIFDEAHQIEDIAAEFFGTSVSKARLDSLLRDAARALGAKSTARAQGGYEHGVPRAAVSLVRQSGGESGPRAAARSLLSEVEAGAASFFDEIAAQVVVPAAEIAQARDGRDAREVRAPLDPSAWAGPLGDARARLDAALEALSSHARSSATSEPGRMIATRAELLRASLECVSKPEGRAVVWAEVRTKNVTLHATPIDVGQLLAEDLWPRVASAVLTSATLSIGAGSSFSFLRARLGLGAPLTLREARVPSPFDFATRALFYSPRDLPESSDPSFTVAAARRALELVRVTGGGAFVLCTSVRAMRAIATELARELPRPPLVQGDAPKSALLSRFKDDGDAVLVATMSFWEGVDVPGDALRLVVIDKIPFAVPTDPVVAARIQALEREGRSAFIEYSVPQAAITLKQGFGRLLRTRRDRGAVAVLDRRLRTKPYGRILVGSLPPARRTESLDDVRAFFSESPAQPARSPVDSPVDALQH